MAANGLQAGQEMELWAPFEPQPLFGVMAWHGLRPRGRGAAGR
ncbi:MAG: sulfurtransferase TusA family protein [Chloroflexota bacterium]